MRYLSQVIGVAGLVLWLAAVAPASIPQSPTATTAEDFLTAQRAFNLATLLGEYERVGSRDPQWDAQAEAFLRAAADYWGGLSSDRTDAATDRVTELGEAALAAGCDDPLVNYVLARIGNTSSSKTRLEPLYGPRIRAALRGLLDRGYHGYRCYAAANAARELLPDSDAAAEARAKLEQTAREQIVRAMVQVTDPLDQRVFYSSVAAEIGKWDAGRLEALRVAIEAEAAIDPWPRDTLLGLIHIELAWHARGGGWASTVTEAGWEDFRKHLDLAREHLTRAWELDPSRPEPASKMISVAMGRSDAPALEMRRWFDRAVSAQFDCPSAYRDLAWGLMPRWHGSHRDRFAFGLECAQTGRFDTDVPWQLIEILLGSRADRSHNGSGDNGFELWRELGAYPHVKRVLASYAAVGTESGTRWRQSIQLGFAWACHEWDDAAELIAALGDAWHPRADKKLGVTYDQIVFDVAGRRGPHSRAIGEALAGIQTGRFDQAIASLEAIPSGEMSSAVLRRAVADRLQVLRWRQAFDQGRPADLSSQGLTGWQPLSGDWRAEDGAIVGYSEDDLTRLVTVGRFGNAWEFSGRAEFDPRSVTSSRSIVLIAGKVDRNVSPLGVRITPRFDQIDAGSIWRNGYTTVSGPIPDKGFAFRLRMIEGVIDVWIDDQLILEGHALERYDADDDNRPGIGMSSRMPGTIWAFRDLQIRPARPGPARLLGGAPPAPR